MNATFVLHAFVNTDRDLSCKSFECGVDRGANYSREPRLNEHLAANDEKHTELAGIPRRGMLDAIQFAAPHRATW